MEPAQRKRNKTAKQIKPLNLGRRQHTPVSVSRQIIDLAELKLNLTLIEQHDTELNKQKEKTQASERKLRAFFNSSSSSHMLIDKQFNIIDFNKATV
jgi:PAS domain-containing protein